VELLFAIKFSCFIYKDEVFVVQNVGGVDDKTCDVKMNLVGSLSNVESVHRHNVMVTC
jgi:hypothetical protein